MRVWANTKFEGHYPVGTAAVVVASTTEEAVVILNKELKACGLPPSALPHEFEEIKTNLPKAIILNDGNY